MNKEQFINKLMHECENNNIKIELDKAEKMYQYKELLLEWNEKINLTAITDDEDIIVKHFIDSLLIVEYIREQETMIDVGTGAGFPGIVLAIYFEGKVNITLLDSLQKRIDFLDIVIKNLKLNNIKTIHARAEELAHNNEYREKYDIAVARAVAPLNILLEYLSGYVKINGQCICMKSSNVDEELQSSINAIDVLNLNLVKNTKRIVKHTQDITRYLLIFNKEKELPLKYPRSYSKIKKRSL